MCFFRLYLEISEKNQHALAIHRIEKFSTQVPASSRFALSTCLTEHAAY